MADGHFTDPPVALTYSSVISWDTVSIALTLEALNRHDVMTADIQNAYIQAPTSEKHFVICGCEFGDDMGKRALIISTLYGLSKPEYPFSTISLHACGTLDTNPVKLTQICG